MNAAADIDHRFRALTRVRLPGDLVRDCPGRCIKAQKKRRQKVRHMIGRRSVARKNLRAGKSAVSCRKTHASAALTLQHLSSETIFERRKNARAAELEDAFGYIKCGCASKPTNKVATAPVASPCAPALAVGVFWCCEGDG